MKSKWLEEKLERQKKLKKPLTVNLILSALMCLVVIVFFVLQTDAALYGGSILITVLGIAGARREIPKRKELRITEKQIQCFTNFIEENVLSEMEMAELDETQAEFEAKKDVIFLGIGYLKLTPSFMLLAFGENGFCDYVKVDRIRRVKIEYDENWFFFFEGEEEEHTLFMFWICGEAISQKDDIVYRIKAQYGGRFRWQEA